MKRILTYISIIAFSVALVWCGKLSLKDFDASTIKDLPTLQKVLTQVTDETTKWTLDPDRAQELLAQLEQKYLDLTTDAVAGVEDSFIQVRKIFAQHNVNYLGLPVRAKRLWLSVPADMQLVKELSKQTYSDMSGYDAITLVYSWTYDTALLQAKALADKAGLYVDKQFAQGQALVKVGAADFITGLDLWNIQNGIIYTNHNLTDTKIEYLITITVDAKGKLTLEATNYKQLTK